MAKLDETKPIEQDGIYQQHVRMISWYLKQDKLLKVRRICFLVFIFKI